MEGAEEPDKQAVQREAEVERAGGERAAVSVEGAVEDADGIVVFLMLSGI